MGFRRDTCKWLQSLDLKIKNPKWDFANGYLVATIFSRYFPNELQVDKFYCGMGTAQKANNWEQLGKFFKKARNQYSKRCHVMHCHDNAAVLFIENVFALLTNTKIPSTIDNVPPTPPNPILLYLQPPASSVKWTQHLFRLN
ncbi:hypothetical protein BC829DRAFT_434707 [Chytridium lagenaria]|nr:hypothetical protein BC829DRAFT_434707 [Chytridium lagenaria]